jgi:DnaJ-class molecular chaperone
MPVVACQNCHGNGQVTVWNNKKKTYEQQKCPACGGSGKINTKLI